MKINSKFLASTINKCSTSMAVLLAIASLVACSSQPSQPSSPNLPPPRPVAATPTPPVQQSAPQNSPQPQVSAQAPAQTAPIAANAPSTTPAPTMSIDTGLYRCELGVRVTVKKIAPDRSSMVLNWKNKDYTLASVSSQSGALRFEDKANGLVWMAIVGKSQLLNSKLGQRLANDCNL
jgi:membrane-bound inhibitor of C-type lysozyme